MFRTRGCHHLQKKCILQDGDAAPLPRMPLHVLADGATSMSKINGSVPFKTRRSAADPKEMTDYIFFYAQQVRTVQSDGKIIWTSRSDGEITVTSGMKVPKQASMNSRKMKNSSLRIAAFTSEEKMGPVLPKRGPNLLGLIILQACWVKNDHTFSYKLCLT